jgi:hypothetical protein
VIPAVEAVQAEKGADKIMKAFGNLGSIKEQIEKKKYNN